MASATRFAIEYEPRLVEEAVLLAVRNRPEERVFRALRDRLYEVGDADGREAAFERLHGAWFERLGLGEAVGRALGERPSLLKAVARVLVVRAAASREEGADLFVRPTGGGGAGPHRRSVLIRLRPASLARPVPLLRLLRHELLHVADMLDPRFGYDPRPFHAGSDPVAEPLLRERYRVLWDAYVDGRLARLGQASPRARALRQAEFRRIFPMPGAAAEAAFDRFFQAEACRHSELVAFALDPEGAGGRCPLCRFPTHAFEPAPDRLPAPARAAVAKDFPGWVPEAGLCRQCADLYRARARPVATSR